MIKVQPSENIKDGIAKLIAASIEDYNKFCHSPFSRAKKNGMATSLSKGNLYEKDEMVYEMRTAKTTSKVQMFGAGPEIATVIPGERVITKLSNAKSDVLSLIQEPVWCHIFQEDNNNKEAVLNAGFKFIGTKVNTFSDVVGIYYKGNRKFIPVPQTENINIVKT